MSVECLMGTYGRYGFACEALTCFLQQTALENATLLIYNQHPTPLAFDHPRVRVINEVLENVGMRQIKARMVELADPAAEFIHWWDDDDLIMPWHLEDCLANVGNHLAWKPRRSWLWLDDGKFEIEANNFEATCIYRASAVRAA